VGAWIEAEDHADYTEAHFARGAADDYAHLRARKASTRCDVIADELERINIHLLEAIPRDSWRRRRPTVSDLERRTGLSRAEVEAELDVLQQRGYVYYEKSDVDAEPDPFNADPWDRRRWCRRD